MRPAVLALAAVSLFAAAGLSGCTISPLGMAYSAVKAGLTGDITEEGRLKGSILRDYDPRVFESYPERGKEMVASAGEKVLEQGSCLKIPYVHLMGNGSFLDFINADPGYYKVLGCAESGEVCYVSTTSLEGKTMGFTLMGKLTPGYNVDFFYYFKEHYKDRQGKDAYHWVAYYPGKYAFTTAYRNIPLTHDPSGPKIDIDGVLLSSEDDFYYEYKPDPHGFAVQYDYVGVSNHRAYFVKTKFGPGDEYEKIPIEIPVKRGEQDFDMGARIEIFRADRDSISYRFTKLII